QCSNCHHYGHHSNKCASPPSCHRCTLPHPTRDHSCPTSTCPLQGRPCSHFTPRCINCDGPHESHSPVCPARPQCHDSSDKEELEEVAMVTYQTSLSLSTVTPDPEAMVVASFLT
ncbi:hypothetical protein L873DRAFT_1721013, partial [Choiromyces venosus 120613-1]